MYTHVWNKYLPVIRLLLKKAINGDQVLHLDASDFDKTGAARKGAAFTLAFRNGRRENLTALSPIAKDFVRLLLQEPVVCDYFNRHEYHLSMNARFQLTIKVIPGGAEQTEEPQVLEKTM